MRDATLYYLNKSIGTVGDVISGGKDITIFGNGTQDIVFTQNGIFENIASLYNTNYSLEFRNVTINEGVTIQGNNSLTESRPFFLKVSGTLTVNGNLNMNGQGGNHANPKDNWGWSVSGISAFDTPYIYSNGSVNNDLYQNLYNYGLDKTFFDGKTRLVGAGSSLHYKWKRGTKYRHRRPPAISPLNGGGNSDALGSDTISSGGGGFLALYYENMNNNYSEGPIYDSVTGASYYPNINCNGGSGQSGQGGPRAFGGGMMVIAARNIVLGPNGSITCNPAHVSELSINSPSSWIEWTGGFFNRTHVVHNLPFACDLKTYRNSGGVAWMNRPPAYYLDWNYGNLGAHRADSGGGGVCFGYQLSLRYTKVNH